MSNYSYWIDANGNEYRYTIGRETDGKFRAEIRNRKGILKKFRSFTKRNKAKAWAYSMYDKARQHQLIVSNNKLKRKAEHESKKPKYTKEETILLTAMKKTTHYQSLITKCNRKIKSLETRRKTYMKKIKYNEKKVSKIITEQKNKTIRNNNELKVSI